MTAGGYEDIDVETYKTRFRDEDTPHVLVDVRTEEEFETIRIPGAINIPLDELQERVDDVVVTADGAPVVLVCQTGVRSIFAAQIIRFAGIRPDDLTLYNLDTGTMGWMRQRWPLERGPVESEE